jgi:hypothetical protein
MDASGKKSPEELRFEDTEGQIVRRDPVEKTIVVELKPVLKTAPEIGIGDDPFSTRLEPFVTPVELAERVAYAGTSGGR